jgi:hypothetical protein
MGSDASSGDPSPRWHTEPMADDTPKEAPADDAKERYRQALERKKAQGGHHGHGQGSSSGTTKGSSAKAGGKREFRRKSG